MTVPRLLSAFPGLVALGLALGLVLSFAFRRKAWVIFLWLPTVSTFGYGTYLILRRFSAIGKVHGPDAGFAGMEGLFLLPALAVCIAGLIAAFFCRPRKGAWRVSTALSAVILCIAVPVASDHQNASHVQIQLFDARGNPLPNVRVQYSLSEGGLGMQAKVLTSDAHGRFDFDVRQNQGVGLSIMPSAPSPEEMDTKPTFWNLGISQLQNTPDQLALRHSWQRSVANQTLNESFTEILPRTREIQLSLTLPDHASLDPAPRRDRVRAAFETLRRSPPASLSYADVCRNVEAIEFIPILLNAYRNKEPGSEGVVDGLAQIAAILAELDRGCREVQRVVRSEPYYPRKMLQNQILQFCLWAGIPEETRTDVPRALAEVQERIAGYAEVLVDFALEQLPRDPGVLKVPSELRQLATPRLPWIIVAMLDHPPTDMQAASRLSHPLWMMGARYHDLQPLLTSDNPLLVIVGCDVAWDAVPDSALGHGIGAQLLARLEATRSQIIDPFAGQRSDNLMQNLRARLKSGEPVETTQ